MGVSALADLHPGNRHDEVAGVDVVHTYKYILISKTALTQANSYGARLIPNGSEISADCFSGNICNSAKHIIVMPNLPSSGHLRLIPDKARLYPKFQSYKLQSYNEDTNLIRISLALPPNRKPLPTNARVG